VIPVLTALMMSGALAAAPLDVVRNCADSAPPTITGLKSLDAACPGLEDALAGTGLDANLIDGWRQTLNAHALSDLVVLAERYAGHSRRAPDTASLTKVLESLDQTPKNSSWWQSFKTWLKNWLARSDSSLASWLNRLLESWSDQTSVSVTFLKIITVCLTALVVVAAVVIVVREIRVLRIGRHARLSAGVNSSNAMAPETDLEAGLVPGSATDAWAVLLRALVRRLLQLGRLRADRSLTHRELVIRSVFETEEQRTAFAAVAVGAEANFYGPRIRAADPGDEVKRRGEALLSQLTQLKSGT
jgi:hypothetical protein